jgi:hypothetical protein
VSLSSVRGATLGITVTNGGTGPTVAGQAQVECQYGGSVWYPLGGALVAGTTASTSYTWSVDVPYGATAVEIIAGSNTAQNVTITSDCETWY